MSEAVKRYVIRHGCVEEASSLLPGERAFVLAADHDRIVASLQAQVEQLTAERDQWQLEAIRLASAVCALGKMEFAQLTDDSKLIEVMSIIREAIQERDTLRAEVERLTGRLQKANEQAEHFEREWYLRGDEVERLRILLKEWLDADEHKDWGEYERRVEKALEASR